jgi:ATP-dependent DNA helicase RecG
VPVGWPAPADQRTLVINVPRGLPHVYAVDGRYWIHENGALRILPLPELRALLLARGDISFEDATEHNVTLDDLDWARAEQYAAHIGTSGETVRDVLHRRGCLIRRGDSGDFSRDNFVPTNAGLLLFGRDPQRMIRGAHITAVRFAGNEMGDVFTRQDISGSLPEQIRRAETFLHDVLRRGVQLGSSMERTEITEYPMEAVRELVVNAVSHRDYSIQGDGIRLYIFADRLEVTSPGLLPGPVTIDNIVEERYSRNPAIVQVLGDMGFIERLGYGVDRVIALMRAHGLPDPQFVETSGGFLVRLFGGGEKKTVEPLVLTPRQERALHYLGEEGHTRITNKDLQEIFPEVHSETIRRDLADLVSKGLLLKMGEKRGSYYILRKGR